MERQQPSTMLQITEYSKRFFQLNPFIDACYNGAKPYVDLAHCLLNILLCDHKYPAYGQPEEEQNNEHKRIYTKTCVNVENILMSLNPVKYADGTGVKSDINNMKGRLKKIHDNNIFYHWKYHGIYMFIMDRDIRAWIYYNESGTVSPLILKKILRSASYMIVDMSHSYKKIKKSLINIINVENSFCSFLNGMIGKMSSSVSKQLPLWDEKMGSHQYIDLLRNKLEQINDEDGIIISEDFLYKLPPCVRKKYCNIEGIEEDEIMNARLALDMEKIIPQEQKMGVKKDKVKKERKPKKNKSYVDKTKSIEPNILAYDEDFNPFEHAKNFVLFFQKGVRMFTKTFVFPKIENEFKDSGIILDMISQAGKKGDKDFLLSWIKWHCKYNLKGVKSYNVNHTCIKKFGDTFAKYNSTYQSVEDKMNFFPE